jgi:hypothetical protein
MRSVENHSAIAWDVSVGKESHGSILLLFSSRGDEEVRRLEIEASSRPEAERVLGALEPESLRSKPGLASALSVAPC